MAHGKLDLSGRVALVTGGSGGIGRACCAELAQAGAVVVIHFRRSGEAASSLCEALRQDGLEAETYGADITDPRETQQLFDFIRSRWNRLDVLVNNAGIIRDNLLPSMRISDWDQVIDADLTGAFLTTRLAAEMMILNHSGKIINIASTAAVRGGRGQTNYAAAKGGLVAFSRACAVELASKNIQVNAVLPGVIDTSMSERARRRRGEEMLRRIPAARFGEPTDVAGLILFLASGLSGYITGQAIAVDGGLSIA